MYLSRGRLKYTNRYISAKPDTYHIDTSNVLFILSGAFVGLDNVVKRRVAKGVCELNIAITVTFKMIDFWYIDIVNRFHRESCPGRGG